MTASPDPDPPPAHSPLAQGGANTIREQQQLFQAAKKITGNTHTASKMGVNIPLAVIVIFGGGLSIISSLNKLYHGTGKIELKD